MGFKKPASENQAKYACGKCGEKFIKDKEIYMQQKDDKSWFSCHNLECFKSQGGTVEEKKSSGGKPFASSKFPIGDVPKIFALAETLVESFKKKRNLSQSITTDSVNIEDFNGSNNTTDLSVENFKPLTTEQELQAVESFFKSILTGCKP